MGLLNNKLKAYRTILKKEMAAAHWYQIPVFGALTGHIGGTDGKYPRSVPFGAARRKLLRPTFKPIEVLTDFQHQGGWDMDVPIYYPLTEVPVYGDNPALGKEEKRKWAYKKAVINQVRKPVLTRDGLMGERALDPKLVMQIMENAKDELVDYNRRLQAYYPYDALLRGYSQNILAPKADGGMGDIYTQRSHPNFFVAGSGQVTFSQTPATYETNVATALDALTSANVMNTTVLENMILHASRLRIQRTTVGKFALYPIIMSPSQGLQLLQDTKFLDAQKMLTQVKGELSALFTGALEVYPYRSAVIIIDENCPGVWTNGDTGYDSTRGTINYGNANPIANPIHATDRRLAILLGASAVACGHAVSLGFESETWDYKNKKSEASYCVIGYNRCDIYDNDGMFGTAGDFKENTSSLVVATYSPQNPTW